MQEQGARRARCLKRAWSTEDYTCTNSNPKHLTLST